MPMLKQLYELVVFLSSYFIVYSTEALNQLVNVSSQFPKEFLGRITTFFSYMKIKNLERQAIF